MRKRAIHRDDAIGNGVVFVAEVRGAAVSEDWSYVETADGESGYVSNRYITAVNILGTDFTAVEGGEKIMYATDVVNVRLYPSADDKISDKKGAYQKDDEVTVVATNGKWYRVKFKTESDGTVL